MNDIDEISRTIEAVRESVAVIKAAARDREDWAIRFERAASSMLSLAESLETSLSNVTAAVEQNVATPFQQVLEGLERFGADTRTVVDSARKKLDAELGASKSLVNAIEALSTDLPAISSEMRSALLRVLETEERLVAEMSSASDDFRSNIVAEINKLAVSIPALHDTLPLAVADFLGKELKSLRTDIGRLSQESVSLARATQKSISDTNSDVLTLATEVLEVKELLEELLMRKRGFFRS